MLKKTLATLLLLSSVATAYGIQPESEWVKFTAPKGLFSVLLPQEPKTEVDSEPTAGAQAHQRFNTFGEGYGFVIEYFENVSVTDPEKYLDGTSEDIVKALNGTLVEQKKVSLDGRPGRELTMSLTASNGTVLFARTRIYLVDTSFFSLSYVWRKDIDSETSSKIGEKCFSSLKIKPRE